MSKSYNDCPSTRIRCGNSTTAEDALADAAPDLLAALKSLLPWMSLLGDFIGNGVMKDPHGHGVPIGDDERCRAILAARAVIDRATGYA